MDRVFLDANVLFSAAYREENGLLRLWSSPHREILTSAYAVTEARRNLADPAALDRLDRLLAATTLVPEADSTMAVPEGVELPVKDVPILLAAVACKATHLLTGDLRHFGILFHRTVEGVLILPPGEYLQAQSPPADASSGQ